MYSKNGTRGQWKAHGRYIDVSLMQAATALQSIRLMASHLDGGTIRASGVFPTADGFMTIAAVADRDWRSLCEAMRRPDLRPRGPGDA